MDASEYEAYKAESERRQKDLDARNTPELIKVRRMAAAVAEGNPAHAEILIAELAYVHAREPEALLADMDALILDAAGHQMRIRKALKALEGRE